MSVYSKILAVFLPLLLSCMAGITVSAIQNRQVQEPRPGKGKAVHEYSPEDVLPDAQEDENPRQRRLQTGRPRQQNIKPVLSARENPNPSPVPTVRPATRRDISPSPTTVFPPATAQSDSHSEGIERSRPQRKKLLVSLSLFFLVLISLVYFISKFIKERRVAYQTAFDSATKRDTASEPQQISTESEAATELYVPGSSNVASGMKNKVRKVHNT